MALHATERARRGQPPAFVAAGTAAACRRARGVSAASEVHVVVEPARVHGRLSEHDARSADPEARVDAAPFGTEALAHGAPDAGQLLRRAEHRSRGAAESFVEPPRRA